MSSLPVAVPTGASSQTAPPFPSSHPLPSFWLSSLAPSDLAPILNELPKQADFVVVGGGLTGGSAAYHLAKSLQGTGKTIALIEARELSGGATGRNGGICVPAKEYSWAIAGDLAQGLPLNTDHLAAKNKWELANADALVAFHEEWRQKNPESPVFLERWPDGCIETWVTKKEADTGIMVHKLMEEAGLNVSEDGGRRWEVWSSDEAERRTGIKGVFGAVVYYVAFRVWGAKFVNAVCTEASRLGATLHTHTPVTSITDNPSSTHRWTLTTPAGTISTSHILFATNGYTRNLLPQIPVTPLRGQILLTKPLPKPLLSFDAEISIDYGWLYGGTRADGRIAVGGCRNVLPNNGHLVFDDSEMDTSVSEALKEGLDKFEWLKGKWEIEGQWTGIQGWTPERTPIVGRVPSEGLDLGEVEDGRFIAAGFCGHGMPQVFLAGRTIANLALGKGYDTVVPEYLKVENRLEKWKQLG